MTRSVVRAVLPEMQSGGAVLSKNAHKVNNTVSNHKELGRITKRKAKRRQQKDKSYKINILWDFLLPFGDLDRQKEGIDGQKLVPNSYPRQDFQKKRVRVVGN